VGGLTSSNLILTKLEDRATKEEQMRNVKLEAAAKEREEKLARFKSKMEKQIDSRALQVWFNC